MSRSISLPRGRGSDRRARLPSLPSWLRAPGFEDEERGHRAYLLHVILWALVFSPFPYVGYVLAARPDQVVRALVQAAFGETVNVVLLVALRRGHVELASVTQVTCFWWFFFVTAWTGEGIRGEAYELGFPLVILLAGMLISTRAAIVATVAALLAGLVLVAGSRLGLRGPDLPGDERLTWVLSLCFFPLTAVLQYLTASEIRSSLVRAHRNQELLERANDRIRELNASLERKVAERTAELTASNRELEAFSYAVAHDLRAPLRAISNFSQVLAEDEAVALGPEGTDFLARIRSATRRMDELIHALLELGRITRAELRRADVDLSALARAVVAELARSEPGRAVDLVVEPGLRARADPELIVIVLANLIGNAWKFTSKTATPRIEVGAHGPVFFVRDNGAGFDMKHARQLFAAFRRLHASSDFPGTGVGLATVNRIVERHGGRIWAEGTPGVGATFYFTLETSGAGGGLRAD